MLNVEPYAEPGEGNLVPNLDPGALEDLTIILRNRHAANEANLTHDLYDHKDSKHRYTDEDFRERLKNSRNLLHKTSIFLENPRAYMCDLLSVDNLGFYEMETIKDAENGIRQIAEHPMWGKGATGYLESGDELSEPKMCVYIEELGGSPQIVLQRERKLFRSVAAEVPLYFKADDTVVPRYRTVGFDKRSEFVFNLERLQEDFRLRRFIAQTISDGDRFITDRPNAEAQIMIAKIEAAMRQASDLLIPVSTTFRVSQEYSIVPPRVEAKRADVRQIRRGIGATAFDTLARAS